MISIYFFWQNKLYEYCFPFQICWWNESLFIQCRITGWCKSISKIHARISKITYSIKDIIFIYKVFLFVHNLYINLRKINKMTNKLFHYGLIFLTKIDLLLIYFDYIHIFNIFTKTRLTASMLSLHSITFLNIYELYTKIIIQINHLKFLQNMKWSILSTKVHPIIQIPLIHLCEISLWLYIIYFVNSFF